MERSSSFSNQNQSKTSEELVRKKLNETISASASAYSFYLFMEGLVLEKVSEDIPQVLLPLEKIIENLDEFGECKSFLTNDQETLQKCIDEYNFKGGLLGGIWEYIIKKYTPKQIEEFTKGLEALAKGGKEIIDGLYNRYRQYKTTPIPQKDRDRSLLDLLPEFRTIPEVRAIRSLIFRYLENSESYGKQLSKYLEKKLSEAGVEERKEVKTYEELRNAIKEYANYVSSKSFALHVVSTDIPEALPSLATLIEKLEEWSGHRSLLSIDQEALKEYADKYYFMAKVMLWISDWWLSKWVHTLEEIEEFTKGLEALAKGGKEIIDGLYRLYKEVYKLALEDISKDYQDQTIPSYELEKARASANRTIKYLLMNYFSNPKKYEDQLMKYAGMKPLDWLDRAICNLYRAIYNLYGGCKTEKQNT